MKRIHSEDQNEGTLHIVNACRHSLIDNEDQNVRTGRLAKENELSLEEVAENEFLRQMNCLELNCILLLQK